MPLPPGPVGLPGVLRSGLDLNCRYLNTAQCSAIEPQSSLFTLIFRTLSGISAPSKWCECVCVCVCVQTQTGNVGQRVETSGSTNSNHGLKIPHQECTPTLLCKLSEKTTRTRTSPISVARKTSGQRRWTIIVAPRH